MQKFALAIIVLLFASTISAEKHNCMGILVDNEAVFNFLPFSQVGAFNAMDQHNPAYILSFSLCTPQVLGCNSLVYGNLLFGSDPDYCDDVALAPPTYSLIDKSKPSRGVNIHYPTVEGQTSHLKSHLNIELICNPLIPPSQAKFNLTIREEKNERYLSAIGEVSTACPYATMSELSTFLLENQLIFVLVFLALGIFVCFYGLRMFNITTFLITTTVGTFLVAFFFYKFVDLNTSEWILWFIFIVCIGVGAFMGILAVRYKVVGFFGLGFGLGAIFALFLYQYVIALFLDTTSDALVYAFAIVFGVTGGVLSLRVWKGMAIISTSIIGAYLAVRAVSVYIGGFPSELNLANGTAEFTGWSYLYLLVVVVMSALGIRYQFKTRKGDAAEDKLLGEDIKNRSVYSEILLDNV